MLYIIYDTITYCLKNKFVFKLPLINYKDTRMKTVYGWKGCDLLGLVHLEFFHKFVAIVA